MVCRIEGKKALRFVGYSRSIPTANGINFELVPKFWAEVSSGEAWGTLAAIAKDSRSRGVYPDASIVGICADMRDDSFDYLIAAPSDLPAADGMTVLEIPASAWAVFECAGPLPGAMQSVWKRIYGEWLPSSGYEHATLPEIEWYSDGDVSAQDYRSEIWIPVKRKA